MPTFIFAYRMTPDFKPGGPEAYGAWATWFEGLGGSVVDMGKPAFESTAIGAPAEATRLGGYSLVTADDLESAVALAKGCPAIAAGGGVEVGLLSDVVPPPAS
ncbi:MAG: hypothetical protein J2P57_03490 [Acidimicrobiaceae bacterium]|nr:hypothetical protein [Acidimicrobiaceae bacterium]